MAKDTTQMTEQEAKQYCEEYAKTGKWEADMVQALLKSNYSYRRIAIMLEDF